MGDVRTFQSGAVLASSPSTEAKKRSSKRLQEKGAQRHTAHRRKGVLDAFESSRMLIAYYIGTLDGRPLSSVRDAPGAGACGVLLRRPFHFKLDVGAFFGGLLVGVGSWRIRK